MAQRNPLFEEDFQRYNVYPVIYKDVWKFVELQRKAEWKESEISLTEDKRHWEKLTDDEKHFIKHVLAFFAASDGIVLENLVTRFWGDVKMLEARSFYTVQANMEFIHSLMYGLLIDALITDPVEKDKTFKAIQNYPCIAKKAQWALNFIDDTKASFATRLLAFICVEGIFFSGAFCAIFWLRERKIMPGLASSNELISRDEGIHCEFAIWLYNHYVERLDEHFVLEIVRSAVQIEEEFILEALPCRLLGMNSEMMREYIRYVADRTLKQLGYKTLFNAQQPFPFMDKICVQSVTNFFDSTETNYQHEIGEAKSYDWNADLDF
jgi:ribonucleotide reductase beta subunit family protein with ferritin-like domain